MFVLFSVRCNLIFRKRPKKFHEKRSMSRIKSSITEKKESYYGKKAYDPTERLDVAFKSGKSSMKEYEHACKANCSKDKHVYH